MKKLLVWSCCLIATIGGLFSQNIEDYTITIQDSVDHNYYEKAAEMLELLDLSDVTSGVLYERGFPFVNFEPFKGSITDTVHSNRLTFALAYASLFSMALDSNVRLPAPDGYMQRFSQLGSTDLADTIPIVILHANYHRFKSHALDSNLVSYSGNQFHDVSGRPEDPFQKDSVFLVAAAREKLSTNGALTFTFDSTLWFSNTAKQIAQISIDFGSGYHDIGDGRTYKHIFDSTGVYTFSVRLQYQDSSVYYSKSYINVKVTGNRNGSFSPSYSKDIVSTIIYQGESTLPPGVQPGSPYGSSTAHVYLACGHQDIVKPFIWVEGYNPRVSEVIDLSLDFEDAMRRLNFIDFPSTGSKPILKHLMDEGYDIIVLDYQDGGNYIQRNAYFFVEALNWINSVKKKQGSLEPNVVMGQSMGGMVARYGLRWMEDNDIDHETSTYISFDTGHQGTNIPLGAQMALRHVAGLNVGLSGLLNQTLEDFVAPLRDARILVDLPASRQMLMVQDSDYSLHYQYYSEQNHQYGMPQNCEVLAIANGSINGSSGKQPFDEGERILRALSNNIILFHGLLAEAKSDPTATNVGVPVIMASVWSGPLMAFLMGNNAFCDMEIYALPSGSGTVYRGLIQASILGIPLILNARIGSISNITAIDSAPGGIIGPVFKENLPLSVVMPEFKLNSWAFTPTVSTLHYRGTENHPMTRNGLTNVNGSFTSHIPLIQQNYVYDIDHYIGQNSSTQYYRVDDETNTQYPESVVLNGTKHTHFNPRIAPWFLYHTVGQAIPTNLNPLTSATFNFGKTVINPDSYYNSSLGPVRTQSVIDYNITISGNGKLTVNDDAPIGLWTSSNGTSLDNSVFSVKVRGGDCADDEVIITINDGGKLILGDGDDRRGEVVFYPNTKLIVNEGGEVIVRKGSSLVLRDGAELILNGGSLNVEDNARFIQRNMSEFTYNEGAEFMLTGHNSLFDTHGWINIGDDAIFTIESATNAKGLMVIRGANMNHADWGQNTSMWLIGDDKEDELIRFEDEGMLATTGDEDGDYLNDLRIMHCKVRFMNNMTIPDAIISSSRIISTSAKYVNESTTIQQRIRVASPSQFRSCDFDNVGIWSYLFNPAHRLTVLNCDFYNHLPVGSNAVAILNERGYVDISYSDFENRRGGIKTLNLHTNSSIYSNKITYGVANSSAYIDHSNVEVLLKQNIIDGIDYSIRNHYGKINFLCNTITNTKKYTIQSQFGALDFSTTFRKGGYNLIESFLSSPLIFITETNLYLDLGYNKLTNAGKIIDGTVPWICPPQVFCEFHATGNQWGDNLNEPASSKFYLQTATWQNLGVNTTSTSAIQTCRIFDVGGVIGNPVYSFSNQDLIDFFESDATKRPDLPLIETYSFDEVRLDIALLTAMFKMERRDSSYGDNQAAMSLFEEILSDSVAQVSLIKNQDLLLIAKEEMKYIVEEEIKADSLGTGEHTAFTDIQKQYVKRINNLTTLFKGTENNSTTFSLEMDKMQFMRLLNNDELALDILLNYEQCGVDSTQQVQINHWKKSLMRDLSIKSEGKFEAAFDSTHAEIDTSGFFIPTKLSLPTDYFGSLIISPNKLTLENCSGSKKPVANDNSHKISVYPNPNNGSFTVWQNFNTDEDLIIKVYNLSGQIIHEQHLNRDNEEYTVVNMKTVSPGAYYYRIDLNGAQRFTGKLIVH